MQDVTQDPAGQPERDDSVAILADQLVAAYGADACEVVERQIEAADGGEGLATWNAIWDRLCGPAALRA